MAKRKYRVIYQSNQVRVMSTGDFGVLVRVGEPGGVRRERWYDPACRLFDGWLSAPAYLIAEVEQQLLAAHRAGNLMFWERTADGGVRRENLRYFEAERWLQALGIADPVAAG